MKKMLVFVLSVISLSASAQKNGEYHLDKEFDMNTAGTIVMSTRDATVVIIGNNRKSAHVKIDHEVITKGLTLGSNDLSVEVSSVHGDLEIKEHSPSIAGTIGFSREVYTILLEIPSEASLNIHGDDGDYRFENIGGSIALKMNDGNIALKDCTGSRFSFAIGDGKIRMDQGTGTLDIDGNDSDVAVLNGAFHDIRAGINDGKMEIGTSLTEDGVYSLRAQDGTISMTVLGGAGANFTIRHNDGHVTSTGNFETVEKSDDETRLVLSDGEAKVAIRVNDGDIKLVSK